MSDTPSGKGALTYLLNKVDYWMGLILDALFIFKDGCHHFGYHLQIMQEVDLLLGPIAMNHNDYNKWISLIHT